MNNLSQFPELGRLEIFEVYEFYDEPVLFIARNERDNLFLATLAENTANEKIWYYAPMSNKRFNEVRSGGIDLYHSFKGVEDGYLFSVLIDKSKGNISSGQWIKATQLKDDNLPLQGEYLNLTTVTLAMHEPLDVTRTAKQAYKEVLALFFHFKNVTRTEAPAGLLGQLLDSLQQMVLSLAQSVAGRGTVRGSIPRVISNQMGLSVANVGPGSFCVELHANAQADLFGLSDIGYALGQMFRLIQSSDSEEQLLEVLRDLKGRTPQKYKQFLSRFAEGVEKIDIHWGSPAKEEKQIVSVTAENAIKAINTIAKMEPSSPIEYDILARLVGINVRAKTYEIWDMTQNRKLGGKILNEAGLTDEHLTVNEHYIATIREETETNASQEMITKYRLISLNPCEVDQNH